MDLQEQLSNKIKVDHISNSGLDEYVGDMRGLVIGASGSGKSYFCVYELYPLIAHKYNVVVVFTKKGNEGFYEKNIPGVMVITDLQDIPTYLQRLEDYQVSNPKTNWRGQEQTDQHGNKVYQNNILVIFDDVIDEKLVQNKTLQEAFANYRHLQIDILFIIQASTRVVSTLMKNNVNTVIICAMPNADMRKKLLKEYLVPTLEVYGYPQSKAEELYNSIVAQRQFGKIIIFAGEQYIFYG